MCWDVIEALESAFTTARDAGGTGFLLTNIHHSSEVWSSVDCVELSGPPFLLLLFLGIESRKYVLVFKQLGLCVELLRP